MLTLLLLHLQRKAIGTRSNPRSSHPYRRFGTRSKVRQAMTYMTLACNASTDLSTAWKLGHDSAC